MSRRTFICRGCGMIRRRMVPQVSVRGDAPDWPQCHAKRMELLSHAEAAGAAHLRREERLTWLAHGKRVVRRAGNRWMPVMTEAKEGRADNQLHEYRDRARRTSLDRRRR